MSLLRGLLKNTSFKTPLRAADLLLGTFVSTNQLQVAPGLCKKSRQTLSIISLSFFIVGNDSMIYMLNGTTKESRRLTSVSSSNSVFTSTKLILAYSANECSIHLKYLSDDSDTLPKEGARSSHTVNDTMCYQPQAWSPNGNTLAYIGLNWADP